MDKVERSTEMAEPRKKKREFVSVHVQLTPHDHKRLKILAVMKERSVSSIARVGIRKEIRRLEKEDE